MATDVELAAHAIGDLHGYLDQIQDQLIEVRDYINENIVNEDAYGELLKPINDAVKTYGADKLDYAITMAFAKLIQPQREIWKVGQQLDLVDGEVSAAFKHDPYTPAPNPHFPPGHPANPTGTN